MTTWWWVRHGPTHAKGMTGWTDRPADLSDHAALARLAAHLPPDALVVSSDLLRARTTADAIQQDRRRLPHAPALREIHFGAWEDLTFPEITARDPDLARQYWETPGEVAPPQGESWNMLAHRVRGFVDQQTTLHPGRDLVAVAHFAVILTEVQHALGIPARDVLGQRIDTLSVTRIRFDGRGWQAGPINHIP